MNLIYEDALKYWGIDAQKWALIEEMGEVMQVLSHEKRGRVGVNMVINELIDLQTTINMLRVHYVLDCDWDKRMQIAEKRLQQKITEVL